MTLDIRINDKADVEHLNSEACRAQENLWVHSNDGLIMVDARSLLGLFALIGKPCKLVGEDYLNPKVLTRVARRAGVLA